MESIMFLGLNGYAWITIATVLGIFVVMARTRVPADHPSIAETVEDAGLYSIKGDSLLVNLIYPLYV